MADEKITVWGIGSNGTVIGYNHVNIWL